MSCRFVIKPFRESWATCKVGILCQSDIVWISKTRYLTTENFSLFYCLVSNIYLLNSKVWQVQQQ